jgi:hypothetical protein
MEVFALLSELQRSGRLEIHSHRLELDLGIVNGVEAYESATNPLTRLVPREGTRPIVNPRKTLQTTPAIAKKFHSTHFKAGPR